MSRSIATYVFYLVSVSALIAVVGCGNGLVGLKGKVTYSDDGSPLTAGCVCFDDGKTLARGRINSDGTYTVGTLSQDDGLAPGTYKVYITQAIGPDPSGERAPEYAPLGGTKTADSRLRQMVPLIDSKITTAEKSGMELDVTSATKTYDIVVDRFSAARKN